MSDINLWFWEVQWKTSLWMTCLAIINLQKLRYRRLLLIFIIAQGSGRKATVKALSKNAPFIFWHLIGCVQEKWKAVLKALCLFFLSFARAVQGQWDTVLFPSFSSSFLFLSPPPLPSFPLQLTTFSPKLAIVGQNYPHNLANLALWLTLFSTNCPR